jgi:methylmalonyl-CoA mutase N-terminal domain/subunit
MRAKRDRDLHAQTLAALKKSSAQKSAGTHLMPLIIDAVRARATVGEIAATLAENWGYYRPAL